MYLPTVLYIPNKYVLYMSVVMARGTTASFPSLVTTLVCEHLHDSTPILFFIIRWVFFETMTCSTKQHFIIYLYHCKFKYGAQICCINLKRAYFLWHSERQVE